ncbi:hypothetical protein, conserved [Eimeria praecox]|uniref:Uncharacterized protein n=1 Tax=Eimeria praecox TaxID=51316 RepID=U6H4B1_9EIME|nr:hypothetical protein, conserved [Eimeria praecox]
MEAKESGEGQESTHNEPCPAETDQQSVALRPYEVQAKPAGETVTSLGQETQVNFEAEKLVSPKALTSFPGTPKLAVETNSESAAAHVASRQDGSKQCVGTGTMKEQFCNETAGGIAPTSVEIFNNATRQLYAQPGVESLAAAKEQEAGVDASATEREAANNEFTPNLTLSPSSRVISEPQETAAGPFGSGAGKMASKGIPTAVALASETAAALLSAAVETAAAMETGGQLHGMHRRLPTEMGRPRWNASIQGSYQHEPSYEKSPSEEQRNLSMVNSSGEYKSNSELNGAGSTTVDEEDDLPAFADDESIALYGEIRDKQRLLSRQGTELGQKAERVVLMRQHLQQLKSEADHLEDLVAAKEAHINSDKHMEGVAIRQASKLRSEMQQQQQQQQQLQSRLTALQIDVAKGQEQMDCFKLRMKWNEEELAQWRSAAHQKEEDLACIAEFKKKDDVRAAGLMTQAQRASTEVTEAKKRLQEEQTAALAARAELQRSLEYFAEQQKDRALLIAQG